MIKTEKEGVYRLSSGRKVNAAHGLISVHVGGEGVALTEGLSGPLEISAKAGSEGDTHLTFLEAHEVCMHMIKRWSLAAERLMNDAHELAEEEEVRAATDDSLSFDDLAKMPNNTHTA